MNIEISNLSTSYGERILTRNLTATLRGGEVVSLLGANGTGKSTLIRALMKQDTEHIGVVLTDRVDAPHLRVYELVSMGRMPHTGFFGTLSSRDEAIVSEAMLSVGVQAYADRVVNTLSDGERQKVMIAKVLAQQTPVILLDEPTAFLDFPSKVEMMLLLQHLAHDEGKSILLSTHDVNLALRLSDRLWLMQGESVLQGTPEQLQSTGAIAAFLGDSAAYL